MRDRFPTNFVIKFRGSMIVLRVKLHFVRVRALGRINMPFKDFLTMNDESITHTSLTTANQRHGARKLSTARF